MRFNYMRLNYMGIDPGLKGGVVIIDQDSNIIEAHVMPADPIEVVKLLGKLRHYNPHVLLEKAQAMPKQGATSMFTYGVGYGVLQGAVMSLGMAMTLIRPREWQKLVFEKSAKMKPKDVARQTAMNLWPDQSWMATPRCSKPHEGMIDAALISEAGRRLLK